MAHGWLRSGEARLHYAYGGRVPRPDALLPSGSSAGGVGLCARPGLPSSPIRESDTEVPASTSSSCWCWCWCCSPFLLLPLPPRPAGGNRLNRKHSRAEAEDAEHSSCGPELRQQQQQQPQTGRCVRVCRLYARVMTQQAYVGMRHPHTFKRASDGTTECTVEGY